MIDPTEVTRLFMDSLFRNEELVDGQAPADAVLAEGIVTKVGFNPTRLESHRAEVVALLDELPDQFKEKGGGGWSFLMACDDRHGVQWTGLHQVMEQLFLLGMGLGRVRCQLPRELWAALPGSMPYYVITEA